METLEILVGEVFNNKDTYREGDYIVIMNILKEAYHILKGDFDDLKEDKEVEVDIDSDDEDDHYNEDEDNPTYTGTYIQSY
mgnify:FL=1|tara:strand:+ start:547 stop:789 length:243 start_codon:yes stop_codon:yes gene_type:complete